MAVAGRLPVRRAGEKRCQTDRLIGTVFAARDTFEGRPFEFTQRITAVDPVRRTKSFERMHLVA